MEFIQKIEIQIMNKKKFLLSVLIIFFLSSIAAYSAKTDYFSQGKILFEKKKFEDSKFFFEKDIVFNPKSEKSYLYLAKIYNKKEEEFQEEMNLNNVLILNPKNDEAIYMLILIKINQSDYKKANALIEKFEKVCKSFCSKKDEIKKKFSKLKP